MCDIYHYVTVCSRRYTCSKRMTICHMESPVESGLRSKVQPPETTSGLSDNPTWQPYKPAYYIVPVVGELCLSSCSADISLIAIRIDYSQISGLILNDFFYTNLHLSDM